MDAAQEWFDLWLTVPAAQADWAGHLLFEAGSAGVLETPLEPGRVRVVGSFRAPEHETARVELEQWLRQAVEAGDLDEEPEVGAAPSPQVDWQEVMRHHHRPFRVAGVLVRPPWVGPTGEPEVVLEPGMAFGTGSHETTQLCLQALAEELERHPAGRLLDVGTGSGILALVALRMAPELRAVGCDVDADAVDAARAAAKDNGLADRFELHLGRLDPAWGRFPLVVANLQWNVFQVELPAIVAAVDRPGVLLCSGLLLEQEAEMVRLAERHGLTLAGRAEAGEWCLLRFEARA